MSTFALADDEKKQLVIGQIYFHGVQSVAQEEVKKWFGLQAQMKFMPAELVKSGEALLRGYYEREFVFTRIDSMIYNFTVDSSKIDIHVYIKEDQSLRLGEMKLLGLDSTQNIELVSRFNTRQGQRVDLSKIEEDIDDALQQMEKKGHPFCRFELQNVRLDSLSGKKHGLGLDWKVVYGPQLMIREIQIGGNKITKQNVIQREIRIKPGEKYSPLKTEKIKNRLMRTGYFTRVDEPVVYLGAGQEGGLFIQVEEGRASRFDGVLGYTPGQVSSKGYFTGLIDISLGNLFGTGRSLQAHWQKRDRETQDILLSYREPWIAGFPIHLGLSFAQLIQDSTYVQRDLSLDINMPIFENLALTARMIEIEITPDSLGSYVFGLFHSSTFNVSLGLEYDSRDDRLNPQQGVYYQTAIQNGQKKNFGPKELLQDVKNSYTNRRMTLDFELYLPLFKRQILAMSLHGRQIKSNEKVVPLPDQFRLGGAKSLRGYREDQFRGSNIAWTNLEYRYWLGRRSRAFLFADYGYYDNKIENGKIHAYRLGYGFGVRLQTGLGIMGVDYGLSSNEDLLNGKIHLSLTNEF